MSLTTALFTGLTGMDVHTKSLDVIGNNITNVNTVGFKGSRAVFETQLSANLGAGSAPSGNSGGTNPSQIGLGVKFSGVQRNLNNGAIQPTGTTTDLALEGGGFFILDLNGAPAYTRDGSFRLDSDKNLVASNGGIVQGFGIDENFNITPGVVGPMNIPVGTLTIAEATRNVTFAGNLNASGAVAVNGSLTTTQAIEHVDGITPITGASALTDLSNVGAGVALFATGNVITVSGAEKGGKALGTFSFEVGPAVTGTADTAGTTLNQFMQFLDDALGINEDPSIGDGAGTTFNTGTGMIEVAGNFGSFNDLNLQTADLVSTGATSQPLVFSKQSSADGESVRTTFQVYDSLGTPLTLDVAAVLVGKNSTGTQWRYFAESIDDTDLSRVLETTPGVGGTGILSFDTFGEIASVTNQTLIIDRTNTGAVDPLTVTLNFTNGSDSVRALTDTQSSLAAISQDGSPVGKLDTFSIGESGVITGAFTNGLSRTLGQVALATFANPEGLLDAGSNTFVAGPNSGLAVEVEPQTFGAGRIISGALELSNVDLSQEFVNLITTSTGFSASSRVITTSDQLIQQLLSIAR